MMNLPNLPFLSVYRWSRIFICSGMLSAIVGCADDSDGDENESGDETLTTTTMDLTQGTDSTTGDTGTTEGDTGAEAEIDWGACPNGFIEECARVEVPTDWNDPSKGDIEVFVSRYTATKTPARRQMWMLQGGPGGSGEVFAQVIPDLSARTGDMDIYVLEHRGVGESTRLECPDQEAPGSDGGYAITEAEMPACIAWLQQNRPADLAHTTITQAARDLQYVIQRTATPEQQVYVYGVSYGVLWALRYLQVDPVSAAGVILDSLPAPSVQFLSDFDIQFDPIFQDLLAICSADSVCSEKMGEDPWGRIQSIAASLAGGHCSALQLETSDMKVLNALLLMIDPLRKHLPAIYYRLERCDEADVSVLSTYFSTLNTLLGSPGQSRPRNSTPVQYNISLSELWREPAQTAEELIAICDSKVLCPQTSVSMGKFYDTWPRYPKDEYAGLWPSTTIPVLSLNGELDPQTPHTTASEVTKHLNMPNQTYVQVPYSPHGVLFASPVKSAGQPTCGVQMALGFMNDPSLPIDTTCLNDLVPLDFVDTSGLVPILFGQADIWENDAEKNYGPVATPDWKKIIEALRDRAKIGVGSLKSAF